MVITDNPIKVCIFWKLNEWASHTTIIYSRKQIQVHDTYHIKNNNVYRNWQETNVQNKNISLSLNERHITVLFRKRFTLAASINAMTGYSTRCSVHWFFGGKSATTFQNVRVNYKRLVVGSGNVHVFEVGRCRLRGGFVDWIRQQLVSVAIPE